MQPALIFALLACAAASRLHHPRQQFPQVCEWGQWGEWGDCSSNAAGACGVGSQTRNRNISTPGIWCNAHKDGRQAQSCNSDSPCDPCPPATGDGIGSNSGADSGNTSTIVCDAGFHIVPCSATFNPATQRDFTCYDGDYDETPACAQGCPVDGVPNSNLKFPGLIPDDGVYHLVCKDGYVLLGNTAANKQTLQCDDGALAEPVDECVKVCEIPGVPHSNASDPSILLPGDSLTVECKEGFLEQNTSLQFHDIECLPGGQFDFAICVPQACDITLADIPGSNVDPAGEKIWHGDHFTVECDKHLAFSPQSQELNPSPNGTITCLKGELDVQASCDPVCKMAPQNNSNLNQDGNNTLSDGGMTLLVCDEGYSLDAKDAHARTLLLSCSNQTIVPAIPQCLEVCVVPAIPNSNIKRDTKLTNGTESWIECKEGFELSSGGEFYDVLCADGELVNADTGAPAVLPDCAPITDCTVEPLKNTNIDDTNVLQDGESLDITCDAGFEFYDSSTTQTVTCNNATVAIPPCNPILCNQAPVAFSDVQNPLDIFSGDSETITCWAGYSPFWGKLNPGLSVQVACFRGSLSPPSVTCRKNCVIPPQGNSTLEAGAELAEGGQEPLLCNAGFAPTLQSKESQAWFFCKEGKLIVPTAHCISKEDLAAHQED